MKGGRVVTQEDEFSKLIWNYTKGKSSPFAQFMTSMAFGTNFNKSQAVQPTNKFMVKVPRWKLMLPALFPIPVEEARKNYQEGLQKIKDGMAAQGMKENDIKLWLGSIGYGALTGLTGIRIGEAPEPMTHYERVLRDNKEKDLPDEAHQHELLELSKQVAQKDYSGVEAAYKKGDIGEKDYKRIIKNMEPSWVSQTDGASLKAKIESLWATNPDQRPYVNAKIHNSFTYIRKGGIWNKLSKNRKEYYIKLHDRYEEVLKKIAKTEQSKR